MFFDDFKSKLFGQKPEPKNPLNDSYYYDSNGCIKLFEQVISLEKDKLKTMLEYKIKIDKEIVRSGSTNEFRFLNKQIDALRIDAQEKHIQIQEDMVYIMKNTVALEKEIYSMVNRLRNHPKLKQDNKIWNEIVEEHLPRFRTYGKIMDDYAEKLVKRMNMEK